MLLIAVPLLAQDLPAPQLPPSEELKAAAEPLGEARAQPDDYTPADMYAYRVGVSRAGHACLDHQPWLESLAKEPDELLAFTHLCLFGLRYEPARQGALRYLNLPSPPQREQAILYLAQAYLGLKDVVDAAGQVIAAETDYAYDAKMHFAADDIILAGALADDQSNASILALCADQTGNTLPLLESGKSLPGIDLSATAGVLFEDAVRCLEIERDLKADSAAATLRRLERIAALPAWQHTAQYDAMQSALARAEMVGKPARLAAITGEQLHAAEAMRRATVNLAQGTVLLIPFTLWAPSTAAIVGELHATTPRQPIYLLTSWTANTGDADKPTPEIYEGLRKAARTLPARVSVLVVPDDVLRELNADAFPAAVVLHDGTVQANLPLAGDAGKRLTVFALGPITPASPKAHASQTRAGSRSAKAGQ